MEGIKHSNTQTEPDNGSRNYMGSSAQLNIATPDPNGFCEVFRTSRTVVCGEVKHSSVSRLFMSSVRLFKRISFGTGIHERSTTSLLVVRHTSRHSSRSEGYSPLTETPVH